MSGRRGGHEARGGSRGQNEKRREQPRVRPRRGANEAAAATKTPIILAKPDRPKEPSPRDQDYELQNPKPSEVRQLLARRDSLQREDTESPKPEPVVPAPKAQPAHSGLLCLFPVHDPFVHWFCLKICYFFA